MRFAKFVIPTLAAITLSVCAATAEQPTATDLTVLSYNIRNGGRRMDGVYHRSMQIAIAARQKADFVALQEVDRKTSRVKGVDVPTEFADALSMKLHYAPAIKFAGGEYGTATLTRHTPVSSTIIPMPTPGEDRASSLTVAKLADGTEVIFVSIHFDSTDKTDAGRLANTSALLAALTKENPALPVILAGDFNATPDSPIFKLLADAGFRRCEAKPGADLSFPADKPFRLIDFVLIRDGATTRIEDAGTEVLNEPLSSDHRPLLSHLRVVTKSSR